MTALLSEDALGLVEAEVRELIRRRGLDPVLELERTRELVDAAVRDYDQRSARGVLPALADLDAARALAAEGWRDLMEDVRQEAYRMADAGLVDITQQGRVVDGRTARGPIRVRLR